jgi:hypothetical protein
MEAPTYAHSGLDVAGDGRTRRSSEFREQSLSGEC